ncbi:hypothetical protein Droror1_Dr00015511 [Drosera rotundifolia]
MFKSSPSISIPILFILLLFLPSISQSMTQITTTTNTTTNPRKLRRLPHIFTKTLELPLSADADITLEQHPNFLLYTSSPSPSHHVTAHVIQLHPGLTKLVVLLANGTVDDGLGDVMRLRLPEGAVPELATAAVREGMLVVKVPMKKGGERWDRGMCREMARGGGGGGDGVGRLVVIC